jgi:hypothetical protein
MSSPFIEETWIATNIARSYGRTTRRQRLVASARHLNTSTFSRCPVPGRYRAACVIDSPIKGRDLPRYVEQSREGLYCPLRLARLYSPADIGNAAMFKTRGSHIRIEKNRQGATPCKSDIGSPRAS